jgi:hypothetical protein
MQTIKFALLSLAFLAGCDLFATSNDKSNAPAPPVYQPGATGTYANRDAGGDATPGLDADAALPAIDANGPDATKVTVDAAPDVPPALNYPTKIWTAFGRAFATCEWFKSAEALCATKAEVGTSGTLTFDLYKLYKTDEGRETWALLRKVDTGNSNPAATVDVYMPTATDLWFVTGASGTTPTGTIGNSPNGGLTWYSKADKVFSVLSKGGAQVPLRQIRSGSGGALWLMPDGTTLLRSKDGGDTWTPVSAPSDFGAATTRSLLTVGNQLYLTYVTGTTMGLYTASTFGDFSAVPAVLPAGSMGTNAATWFHASANVPGIFMSDRSPAPNWSTPFWIYALLGGTTPTKIASAATAADTKLVALRDGMVVERGVAAVYLSGVFSDVGGNYLQIRKTTDNGASWTVLHSEPATASVYASLAVDSLGNIHALRLTTDSTGKAAYDGHTIIE